MATETTLDLAALSLDELEDELATLASHLYAGTCRWLEVVAEVDSAGRLGGVGERFLRRVARLALCADAAGRA
jgi:hypothetical protein